MAGHCDPARAPACGSCVFVAMLGWTGPREGEMDAEACKLLAPVPGERWPYGPPEAHEPCCRLHAGELLCDCKASDASDDEWGVRV